MDLPEKLKRTLDIKPKFYQESFRRLHVAIESLMPSVEIRPTARYGAFYSGTSLLVYIDAQMYTIKLGFFQKDILEYFELHPADFVLFPDWNGGHRKLVGFELARSDKDIRKNVAVAGVLILTTYQKRIGWPKNWADHIQRICFGLDLP